MNDFDKLAKDRVTIEKPDGSTSGPFKATVAGTEVVIFADDADVVEGDVVCRPLPSGRTDRLLVTEAAFYQALGGIPANHQLKVRKAALPPPQSGGQNITIQHAQAVQIGDYNNQQVVGAFGAMLKAIDAADVPDEDKAEARSRLGDFLKHPLVSTLMGAAGSALLGCL